MKHTQSLNDIIAELTDKYPKKDKRWILIRAYIEYRRQNGYKEKHERKNRYVNTRNNNSDKGQ